MTLILALGNNDQMIQISDRRLSSDGVLVDDEANKCGVLFCANARMAFGYTGLARWQSFSTPKWLLQALHDSAPPDFTIGETLERLRLAATETFKTHSDLKRADSRIKRLAIIFSGYINLDGAPRQGCAILSNYHNFKLNSSFPEAREEFEINYSSATKGVEWPTLVQRVGNWHGIVEEDIESLRRLLVLKKPRSAVVDKAVEVIRDISDRRKSMGTIGKQLTSIIIPYDPNQGVESNYHTEHVKAETYFPAAVYLFPNQHLTVDNISIRPVDADTPPISVPKVNKNQPCPCGSKIRYKNCHGKKQKR